MNFKLLLYILILSTSIFSVKAQVNELKNIRRYNRASSSGSDLLHSRRHKFTLVLNDNSEIKLTRRIRFDIKQDKSYIKYHGNKIWAENTKSISYMEDDGNGVVAEVVNGKWLFPIYLDSIFYGGTVLAESFPINLTHVRFGKDSLVCIFNDDEKSKSYLENKVYSNAEAFKYIHNSNLNIKRYPFWGNVWAGTVLGFGIGELISANAQADHQAVFITGAVMVGVSIFSFFPAMYIYGHNYLNISYNRTYGMYLYYNAIHGKNLEKR